MLSSELRDVSKLKANNNINMFFVLQIIYDHIIAFNWFALIYVHTPFPTPLVATFGKDNHFLNMGSFFIAINMVGCRLKIARGRLVWVYHNRKEYYARSSRHFRVHFVVRVCCDSVVNSVEWALLMTMGKKGNHSQWQLQRHFLPLILEVLKRLTGINRLRHYVELIALEPSGP